MKLVRWVLGALILVYGLVCGLIGGVGVLHKLGQLKTLPPHIPHMTPMLDATPWWLLAVWGVVVILLLVTATRLFNGGKALAPFVLAIVGEGVLWWFMHKMPTYAGAMPTGGEMHHYYLLGALLVTAVVIWLTERNR